MGKRLICSKHFENEPWVESLKQDGGGFGIFWQTKSVLICMLSVLECDECLALEQDTLHANEDIYKNDWLGMLNIAFEAPTSIPLWVHQFYFWLICLSKINFSVVWKWFSKISFFGKIKIFEFSRQKLTKLLKFFLMLWPFLAWKFNLIFSEKKLHLNFHSKNGENEDIFKSTFQKLWNQKMKQFIKWLCIFVAIIFWFLVMLLDAIWLQSWQL